MKHSVLPEPVPLATTSEAGSGRLRISHALS